MLELFRPAMAKGTVVLLRKSRLVVYSGNAYIIISKETFHSAFYEQINGDFVYCKLGCFARALAKLTDVNVTKPTIDEYTSVLWTTVKDDSTIESEQSEVAVRTTSDRDTTAAENEEPPPTGRTDELSIQENEPSPHCSRKEISEVTACTENENEAKGCNTIGTMASRCCCEVSVRKNGTARKQLFPNYGRYHANKLMQIRNRVYMQELQQVGQLRRLNRHDEIIDCESVLNKANDHLKSIRNQIRRRNRFDVQQTARAFRRINRMLSLIDSVSPTNNPKRRTAWFNERGFDNE